MTAPKPAAGDTRSAPRAERFHANAAGAGTGLLREPPSAEGGRTSFDPPKHWDYLPGTD